MPDTDPLVDWPLLRQAAVEAAAAAYCPYSGLQVGAAGLVDDGRIITGCNVENASYGLTICAERTAAQRMCAQTDPTSPGGADKRRIVTAAVIGLKAAPCFPCGACRQVLHEFGCGRVIVELDGAAHAINFADLLPHAFGPADLA